MGIVDLKDLETAMGGKKRLMAIDHGTKTLGLAITDPLWTLSTPLETIRRTKFSKDILKLKQIVDEFEVGGFILGLPKNMDGSEGPRCQSVRHFADNMIGKADVLGFEPIIALWDERLSTAAVERFMIDDLDMSRAKRAQNVDRLAAHHILQGALGRLSYL